MKRTVISYRVMQDDTIFITAIKNVASLRELKNEFGERVGNLYANICPRYYYRGKDNLGCARHDIVLVRYKKESFTIKPFIRMSRDAFSEVVSLMKAAGENLKKIQEEEDKQIKI